MNSRSELRRLLREEIAPLQLLDHTDEGGMGEVFFARDPRLRRTLAIKVLKTELASKATARARFLQEARVIAAISHPNVINIHSVGELADGTPYYLMDHVAGGSLRERMGKSGLGSVQEARRIVGEIASALHAAHVRGVVHRDVKPSNVLYDDDTGRPLLTDWGIAQVEEGTGQASGAAVTGPGEKVGSPGYMSPEQMSGDLVGPSTDVYALGLLAFDLATGKGPFSSASAAGLMAAHFAKAAPELDTVRTDVDPEFSEIVSRCLAKDPSARPTALEVAKRLGGSQAVVIEWPPPGLDRIMGRGPPLLRRIAVWLGVSLVLMTALMQQSPDGSAMVPAFLVGSAACLISLTFALLAGIRLLPLFREVGAARRRGFDWKTVMDVLADSGGDTGLLLTGSREFGGLSTLVRQRLARARRSRVVLPVVSGGFGIVLLSLTALRGPVFSLFTLIGLIAVLSMVSGGLRVAENRVVGGRRAAVARRRGSTPELTDSWYRSLEVFFSVRSPTRPSPILLVAVLLPLLIGLAGVGSVAIPTLIVGTSGEFADALMSEMLDEMRIDIDHMRQLDAWRGLVLPAQNEGDGGPMLSSALSAIREAQPGWREPEVSYPPWTGPRRWEVLLGPFGIWEDLPEAWVPPDSSYYRRATDGSLVLDTGLVVLRHNLTVRDSLLTMASRGLSTEQVNWIDSLTGHPSVAALGSVALMETVNLAEAVWDSTGLARASIRELDADPASGLEVLETLKYLEASRYVHEGRWTEAENALRELITVAFKLSDSDFLFGRPRIDNIVEALYRLAGLYDLRGDTEGRGERIRTTLAGLEVDGRRQGLEASPRQRARDFTMELLADPQLTIPHQFALARAAALSTRCGSLFEVAAGPDTRIVNHLESVRKRLVDTPLKGAYWSRFVDGEPDDATVRAALRDYQLPLPLAARLVPSWLAWPSEALGNPRIAGCRWYLALAEIYAFR